jgi:hypothetical protein
MIKKILPLLAVPTLVFGSNIPKDETSQTNSRYIFRYFHKFTPKIKSLLEYDYRTEANNNSVKNLKLGARYRLHKNFKVGAFYKLAKGQRHDDDWVWKNWTWLWQDTKDRSEDIIQIEASYKNNLLTLENTIFEIRLSDELNLYNDQNSIKLRPGITHFFFNDEGPTFNLYAFYEAYIPLNYSKSTIYEHWLYTGAIYHYSKILKPGLFYNYKSGTWTSSKDFKDRNLGSYSAKHSSHYFGLNLNVYY